MGKMKEIDIDVVETLEFIIKRLRNESRINWKNCSAYRRIYYENLILQLQTLLKLEECTDHD